MSNPIVVIEELRGKAALGEEIWHEVDHLKDYYLHQMGFLLDADAA